jgi:hypothetical protein
MPYASLTVSCGEPDRAGDSADGGASATGGGTGTLAFGFSVREALGLGEGFGVPLPADFEAEGVGVGVEGGGADLSPSVGEGVVGFAARDDSVGIFTASQNAAPAMIAKTAPNRMTFRQSNATRRRSGCHSDACSEPCLAEASPRPEGLACPSGKSDARHDIGPNIRLTVIYWEGKGAE